MNTPLEIGNTNPKIENTGGKKSAGLYQRIWWITSMNIIYKIETIPLTNYQTSARIEDDILQKFS